MINIIYPLKKSSWDKEILYSLRSLAMYFEEPVTVHVCGDYFPSWMCNVQYHQFTFSREKNTDENIAPILAWSCEQFTDFVWMSDDIYFLKSTKLKDLLPHPCIGNLSGNQARGAGAWRQRLWATVDMLEEFGISPVYNHITHTPSSYNSERMLQAAKNFPIFQGKALHEVVYYNLYQKTAPRMQEKIGYYRKHLPIDINKEQFRFLNHDDSGLSDILKKAIEEKFNIKSKYER